MSESLIFVADVLAYGSYCIRLTLMGITASEKYFMPVAERLPNQYYITVILCLLVAFP